MTKQYSNAVLLSFYRKIVEKGIFMANGFLISKESRKGYENTLPITEDYALFYNSPESLHHVESEKGEALVCHGYLFDVRNPYKEVKSTLEALLDSDNMEEDFSYLNGHFILIHIKDEKATVRTDAVSLTPVYYSESSCWISNDEEITEGPHSVITPGTHLCLPDMEVENEPEVPIKLSEDKKEVLLLDLVKDQYVFFEDKDLYCHFRSNLSTKALLSILHPVLFKQHMIVFSGFSDEKSLHQVNGKRIAREYRMEYQEKKMDEVSDLQESGQSTEKKFIARSTLMNLKQLESSKERYQNTNAALSKHLYVYDPFNVPAIQWIIKSLNRKGSDPNRRIVSHLHPSLDFYDFASAMTLQQINNRLRRKLESLEEKEQLSYSFVNEAKTYGYEVSTNLYGKVGQKELMVYPLSSTISKEEEFTVSFDKEDKGLLFIESYFDNPKNAHRIKVEINDQQYQIDEFLSGKFMEIEGKVSIKMNYARDYSAKSWQKAGKLLIREVD
ncbi:hypothetical protein [Salinicoccus roseus]|nr:hypothetical protein [Salinicoccus roseus]